MKPKPRAKQVTDQKINKPDRLSNFTKSLFKNAKVFHNTKGFKISKTANKRVYRVDLKTTDFLRQVSLTKLADVFKRNNMRIMNGTLSSKFKDGKMDPNANISFLFKFIPKYKAPASVPKAPEKRKGTIQ